MKKKTHEEFVQELEKKKPHLEVLDNYINSTTPIKFRCKKCGFIFEADPIKITRNKDCPICFKGMKLNSSSFSYKSALIHNNKYDYSKVNYINAKEKVCIICHEKDENGIEHGEFWQIAHDHLNGHGCPKCAAQAAAIREADTQEDFIRKAIKVHGNKYDYSKVNYINCFTPVTIICPKHGEFQQKPIYHLQGNGCQKCNTSRGEEMVKIWLDSNNFEYIQQYSIRDTSFRNRKRIDVDFYIPNKNIFIEYNGLQHYVPKNRFGGMIQFENQQIRDEDLRTYCNNNNLKLIEISYKYNKQYKINELLNNIILGNK